MRTPSNDFRSASSLARSAPGIWQGHASASWAQGRATFGGLVAAIATRPLLELIPKERWLRSLQVTFVGPLATGPFEVHAQLLREGRAVTTAEARVVQDGSVRCVAIGAFASDRVLSVALAPRHTRPELTQPGVEVPYMEGLMPVFFQNFAIRWDNATFPGSGSPDGHVIGACRFRSEHRPADVCDVLGLLDAFPPAPSTMLKTPAAAASTVSWSLSFPTPSWGGATDAFWSYEVHTTSVHGGTGTTEATLFDPEGRVTALSTQLVAIYE